MVPLYHAKADLAGRRTVPLRWSRHVDRSILLTVCKPLNKSLEIVGKLTQIVLYKFWESWATFSPKQVGSFLENLLCKNFIKKLVQNLRGTAKGNWRGTLSDGSRAGTGSVWCCMSGLHCSAWLAKMSPWVLHTRSFSSLGGPPPACRAAAFSL